MNPINNMNCTHHLLAYADYVNLIGDDIRTIEINADVNTFKYNVFAPMGRFQLELIYLYFPPSSHLTVGCFCPVGLSLL